MADILYVNSTAIHGGAEEALLDIMTAAAESGHRPALVTPSQGWLTGAARDRGFAIDLVPSLPDAMATETAAAQFRPWIPTALRIAAVARKRRAALVHSNTPRTAYHGGLAARLSGARAVTHCYDLIGLPFLSAPKRRLLYGLTDHVMTISHAVENTIAELAPRFRGRITTLHYGFRPELHDGVSRADLHGLFGVPADAFVIGSAAAMTPWKGQDVLVDAFVRVAAARPDAHLVLVGGSQGSRRQDSFEQALHDRVRDRGLSERVTFTGWREDWCSVLRGFHLFVHVPKGPDPLPIVLIRALALGLPSVATRIGGIPEILDESTGCLVPPGDADALSRVLLDLVRDPDRRDRMGASAGRDIPGRFSWERMRSTLAATYGRLLGS